jgi:5-methylcytosine-specific restriction protein A
MSGNWETSNRRTQLPHNWTAITALIKERDSGQCTEFMRDGTRCPDRGTDVDHIEPGNHHHLDNLRLLCKWHHNKKSSAEGNQNRQYLTERRPKEKHPGIIG